MRIVTRSLARVALFGALAGALLVPTAIAYGSDEPARTPATIEARTATAAVPAAAAAEPCAQPIVRGAYLGYMICGLPYINNHTWPDGRKETFVIGLDYAVWHIWQRSPQDSVWSGWKRMNSDTSRTERYGVKRITINPLKIRVLGTNNLGYCTHWTAAGWVDPFYRCN
jgi:hypothetical protein